MPHTNSRPPLGLVFAVALTLSWTLMTAAVALALWSERGEPLIRIATWTSLWVFSVLMPTLSAFTIHRAVARLSGAGAANEQPLNELARLRPYLLLSANMALLSAFALIFGR
jgi:hypothetical protein